MSDAKFFMVPGGQLQCVECASFADAKFAGEPTDRHLRDREFWCPNRFCQRYGVRVAVPVELFGATPAPSATVVNVTNHPFAHSRETLQRLQDSIVNNITSQPRPDLSSAEVILSLPIFGADHVVLISDAECKATYRDRVFHTSRPHQRFCIPVMPATRAYFARDNDLMFVVDARGRAWRPVSTDRGWMREPSL